jgi:hypothetical protein
LDIMLKKPLLIFLLVFSCSGAAHAGFLTGNSSPYIDKNGSYALKMNATIIMTGTPFSAVCLAGKYGFDEKVNISGKYGVGTIDYSTISGVKLTTDPQISGLGLEYIFSGDRKAPQYNALVAEYETVSWSVNRKSNISNEIMLGVDFSSQASSAIRTRYRLAVHNFNAGVESEEKIGTSVRYSLSTEIDYNFSANIKGSFNASIYLGDQVGGILSQFGLGLAFNS